jgi:PAS domain S-box-containing protein
MNPQKLITILVIEDNPADLEFIRLCIPESPLKSQLIEVDTLLDGFAVLKTTPVELILLDLSLPDSQGFKTLLRLLEFHPDIPVIVLTGTNNEIIGNQAIRAGAQDFLVKGQFDNKLLSRSVRYALHRFNAQKELEETAKALTKSEKRYEEAQQLAQFGNWTLHLVSQEMYWSPQVYSLLGYTKEKLPTPTRKDYTRLVHPDDLEHLHTLFDRFDSGVRSETLEYRIVYPNQTVRYLRLNVRLQEELESREIILFGVVQDVTNSKKTESLQQEQQVFQKILPLFVEAIKPLACNPGSSTFQLLQELPNLEGVVSDSFKSAFTDVIRSISLTLNLSQLFGRIPDTSVANFSPNEFVRALVYIWNIQGKTKGVSTKVRNLSPVPALVNGAVASIGELLLTTAVTIMPMVKHQTTIQFSQSFQPLNEEHLLWKMELRAFRTEKHPEFPNGVFSAEQLLSAIETDSDVPILIATRHALRILSGIKGQLRLNNYARNKFRIELRIPVRNVSISKGHPQQPTFLLVDDHFISLLSVKKLLEELFPLAQIHSASSGKDAITLSQTLQADAILVDLSLPDMSGLDLAATIRLSDIPLVALSPSPSESEKNECLKAGFKAYLEKPVNRNMLENTLLALLSSTQFKE